MLTTDTIRDFRLTREGDNIILRADSLSEVEDYGRQEYSYYGSSHYRGSDNGWYGTDSYDEAIRFMRLGWPEGVAMIEQAASRLRLTKIVGHRTKTVRRSQPAPGMGMKIDVVALLAGHPGTFRVDRKVQEVTGMSNRVVKMLVNMGVTMGVKTELINARGAAIAALVKLLTTFGCGVGVDIAGCATPVDGIGSPMSTLWEAKGAGDTLNLSRIAFALLNNGSHRRVNFAIREYLQSAGLWGRYDYGKTASVVEHFPGLCKRYNIVIDSNAGGNPNWTDEQAVRTWIVEQAAKFGIIVS